MEAGSQIARRQVKIVNTYGLHMRPSNKFVKLASEFQSDVTVYHDGRKANGKSMLEMTMLAAECGSTIEIEASGPDDFEGAFATMASARLGALFLSADALVIRNRERLVGLAARHNIPAAYPIREFAAAGGLLSYGPNYAEAYRQVGDYVGRVLNGEKPENLPVQQVAKLELVINMKTAKALGLTVPLSLLGRADEVIE